MAGGELVAAFTDTGIVAAFDFGNELVGIDHFGGGFDFGIGRFKTTVANVFADGAFEEVWCLQHDAELRLEPGEAAFAVVGAIDQDLTGNGFVETADQ